VEPRTADFLYELSQKIEPWEMREFDRLRAASKYGHRVFDQVYYELRPTTGLHQNRIRRILWIPVTDRKRRV